MILEDENGSEYEAGLSGGWRAFALDHKLDDGDALVFQLTEAARFNVIYIISSSVTVLTSKVVILALSSLIEQ